MSLPCSPLEPEVSGVTPTLRVGNWTVKKIAVGGPQAPEASRLSKQQRKSYQSGADSPRGEVR